MGVFKELQHIFGWSRISIGPPWWGDQGHVRASGFQMDQTDGAEPGSDPASSEAPEASDFSVPPSEFEVSARLYFETQFRVGVKKKKKKKKIPGCFFWKAGQTVE